MLEADSSLDITEDGKIHRIYWFSGLVELKEGAKKLLEPES